MESILLQDETMVHEIRPETGPESVDFFRIERMPEVRVEILSAIEEVEDIIEPVVFVEFHILNIFDLSESRSRERIFEDNPLFLSFRKM